MAARTEVVKALWAYIKENNLQNPNDKRQILLDAKMKDLFQVDQLTMFTINKYVSAHMHPFKAVKLGELSENSKKKKKDNAERRKRKKEEKENKKKGKKRRVGTQAPFRLSEDLAAIVGTDILPRPQVTQALWVYIKRHDLQNPEDKREIMCDDMLKKVMDNNEKVTMFTMNKHITKHLVEKLDKNAYVHKEEEGEDTASENENDDDHDSDGKNNNVSNGESSDDGSDVGSATSW